VDNDDDDDDDDQCGLWSGLINGRPGDWARAFIYYSRVFIIGGFTKRKNIQTERTFRERNNDPNNHHYKIKKCLFMKKYIIIYIYKLIVIIIIIIIATTRSYVVRIGNSILPV